MINRAKTLSLFAIAFMACAANAQSTAPMPAPSSTPTPPATVQPAPNAGAAALGARRGVLQQCRGDIATLCAGIKPGGGRLRQCIAENREKLSAPCAAALKDMRGAAGAGTAVQP